MFDTDQAEIKQLSLILLLNPPAKCNHDHFMLSNHALNYQFNVAE